MIIRKKKKKKKKKKKNSFQEGFIRPNETLIF